MARPTHDLNLTARRAKTLKRQTLLRFATNQMTLTEIVALSETEPAIRAMYVRTFLNTLQHDTETSATQKLCDAGLSDTIRIGALTKSVIVFNTVQTLLTQNGPPNARVDTYPQWPFWRPETEPEPEPVSRLIEALRP